MSTTQVTRATTDRGIVTPIINSLSNSTGKDVFQDLLSLDDVKYITYRISGPGTEVINWTYRPYSEGKLGFLGSHQSVDIIAQNDDRTIRIRLFAKSIPYDIPSQAEYLIERGVFNQEGSFYGRIMPELIQGYNGDRWAPVCHLLKNDLMILDDLTVKGYSMKGKFFNKELMTAGLSTLANLHAASLLAEYRLGEPLNRLYPNDFEDGSFGKTGKKCKWFVAAVNTAIAVADRIGLDSSNISSACEQVFEAIKSSPTKANVVSHGDIWGNNLMFNDHVPPKCLLVDFQQMRYSPLAHDVTQFLYLCSCRDFRRIHEKQMIEHYYKTLCFNLNDHQEGFVCPSWSELTEGIEEQRLAAIATAVMYFPTVLMDENVGAEIMNDSITYAEYVFGKRENFVISQIEKDPVYRARIEAAVRELVDLASVLENLPKPS